MSTILVAESELIFLRIRIPGMQENIGRKRPACSDLCSKMSVSASNMTCKVVALRARNPCVIVIGNKKIQGRNEWKMAIGQVVVSLFRVADR
jgi:hypothetical protein